MANFWGPSQGTKIFNKSGVAANGTTNYVNECNPTQLTQIPASLPDLARTIWIAAATWDAAFTSNQVFNLWARGNLYFRTVVNGATSSTVNLTVTVTSGM